MILVAGGDSFVYGSELKDQINYNPSISTYSALLAKMHGFEYECAAWPANANHAITRMTMVACEKYKNSNQKIGVIITWSFMNRYEFRFNYFTGHKISPWQSINGWSVIDDVNDIEKEFKSKNEKILEKHKQNIQISRESGVTSFAKTFFTHVGNSEYYELYSSLKEILLMQYYLEQNKIPYLFLPADNHFFEHPNYYRRKDETIDSLYNNVNWDRWFFFPAGSKPNETKESRGFYQWAVENKYPVGTTHPLEEAHSAAAELIKDKFNELVTKPLE